MPIPRPDDQRCEFCEFVLADADQALSYESEFSVAFRDNFPSRYGHTLVIPRRHVERVSQLEADEYTDLFAVGRIVLAELGADLFPDAFTIGVNDGAAAGQTVPHVHLHLIPRDTGDTADPRGGIRWALPETAPYWRARA